MRLRSTASQRAESRRKLLALLPLPSVQAANVDNLLYGSKDAIGVLSDAGSPERRQLIDAWQGALDRLGAPGASTALSGAEQLNLLRARVLLAQLDDPDGPLPPALLDQARQAVARDGCRDYRLLCAAGGRQRRGGPVLGGRARRTRRTGC